MQSAATGTKSEPEMVVLPLHQEPALPEFQNLFASVLDAGWPVNIVISDWRITRKSVWPLGLVRIRACECWWDD